MEAKNAILIFVTVLNLVWGFFVYLNNKKSPINIAFGVMCLGIAGWAITNAMFQEVALAGQALFWARWSDVSAIVLISSLFYFSLVFPERIAAGKKLPVFLLFVSTICLLFVLALVPDFARLGVNILPSGQKQIVVNKGFYLLAFYFLVFLFWTLLNLINKYRIARAITRVQLKYVFVGLFISTVLAVTTNLILPLGHNYQFVWAGPDFAIIMLIFVGYAIIRHHLMNIRIIATELLVGLVSFVLLIDLLLAKSAATILLKFGILIVFVYLGWSLIKSVLKEMQKRRELEKLTRQLEAANDQLKKLDRAKSEFVSIASHQLRTPLTIIKGYISMVLEGNFGEINVKVKDPLEKVYLSNERLIRLVENLLNISRIESGRMQFEFEMVRLDRLVGEVVEELAAGAFNKSLRLNWTVSKDAWPKVWGDKEKLRQVIMNLVDNAIKYTKKGGYVEVKLKKIGGGLLFCVSDSGIGIFPNDLPKLFKKFSRGRGTSLMHTEGTGLGLFVAKRIITAHKGKIWAESEGLGRGSKFCFQLPINRK